MADRHWAMLVLVMFPPSIIAFALTDNLLAIAPIMAVLVYRLALIISRDEP